VFAGEKLSKPVEAGSLKVGHYVVIDGEPCRILELERSKPGKHGSAKVRIVGIGIFDDSKRSLICPADSRVEVPILEKRVAQVLSTSPTAVQLMDMQTYEVFWTNMPTEDIKSELTPGAEVEYWKALDKTKIVKLRTS
jgi:translation initiation factor 5A